MKKIIVIALVVSINSLYGMEILNKEQGQTFMCLMFPNIFIVQDDINKRCTKPADITIVGMNERRMQFKKQEELWDGPFMGSLEIKCGRVTRWGRQQGKVQGNQLLFITEPQLVVELVEDNESFAQRQYIYKKAIEEAACCSILSRMDRFVGKKAIEEALDDSSFCSDVVWKYAYKYFTQEHKAKSIAVPQFGVLSGIPVYSIARSTVASVVQFITDEKYKDTYGLIELVVPNSEDFNMYKQILLEHQDKHLKSIKERADLQDVFQDKRDE